MLGPFTVIANRKEGAMAMAATPVTVVDPEDGRKAVRHLDPTCPELSRPGAGRILGVMGATATVRALTVRCPACFVETERREAAERARKLARQARTEPPLTSGEDAAPPPFPGSPPVPAAAPLSPPASRHLLEVARCPIVEACLDGEAPGHPCSAIVLSQWGDVSAAERLEGWRESHQLPEPWDGHLETAPILFVSSNPSISGSVHSRRPPELEQEPPEMFMGRSASEHPSIRRLGQGPKWVWANEEIVDRYEAAFDLYIADGVAGRLPDGTRGPSTRFWIEVRSRAQELIPDRPVVPGRDYALTEVVRCKSRDEIGVKDAATTCSGRYLRTTVETSGAVVLVVLGRFAAWAFEQQFGVRASQPMHELVLIGGRERTVVFLPHPNARMRRRVVDGVGGDGLHRLRAALATAEA